MQTKKKKKFRLKSNLTEKIIAISYLCMYL